MLEHKLSQTFSSLQHPNFRLWFGGQIVSLIGTWMQATAQGYLVYELTASPMMLGIVGFANGIPVWLFSLFAGTVADHISRRKMLLITQGSMMVLAFILAVLTFSGTVRAWHIILLALLLGTANAFDAPGRQSFVVDLVPKQELTNAIALNSSVFNLGTIIGPAAAGLVYAWLGPGWCFTINGLSFIAVLLALALMKIAAKPPLRPAQGSLAHTLTEGVRYSFKDANIRVLLVMLTASAVFGFGLLALMPAWATGVLGGDVRTNGLLLSARGLGSLSAALMIAYLGARIIRGRLWSIGSLVMPVSLLLFALFRLLPVSLLMLVLMGWSLMTVVNLTNALIQTHVPDELRGRVMSVYILLFQGGFPIGSLVAGWLAGLTSEALAVFVFASVLLAVSIAIQLRQPSIRQYN
ncbi:MAG TPA: MFS transporter [Anaerolineaceae bacterium]|jgi:MFS family permease|nr:MFS transporter [Anaerolineaceae bacterium]NLH94377.1 MFS transporter [Candidatus Cloacimonadota bacterium]NMC17678.1 MFS transporter [Chloroflexota bacterium]HNS07860.1 MFS transporter [Anaerolineaceae bacterium]HNW14905.1 MFS transporter [Anaerolineaceae bacterium]